MGYRLHIVKCTAHKCFSSVFSQMHIFMQLALLPTYRIFLFLLRYCQSCLSPIAGHKHHSDFALHRFVLSVPELHINSITCMCSWIWFLLFSMLCVLLICTVACISNHSFLLIFARVSYKYMTICLILFLFLDIWVVSSLGLL